MSNAIQAWQLTVERSGVTRPLNQRRALDRIDLAVPQGAVVGVVGRNGAGKTTLIRALLGLVTPTGGHSMLFGAPSLNLPDSVKDRLGYMAQTPDLFRGLTGLAHLQQMASVYRGVNLRVAGALAERLDLSLGQRADSLSLGDQQKLALVLALCHDPDLLVLDEPMASLDPISRRDVLRALFALRQREAPRTVLISSHLLSDLERIVSHVLFMREGRRQLYMRWDDLLEHVRCLPCAQAPADWAPGDLHWSARNGGQLLVDNRHQAAADGRPLDMTDVMELLNS
ncbi:MAG: ABC transporter ATP-binding protein [Methylotenera sp.]|jgi:ABC-2 type transport system ATP-binding protein|nr:ABC transporter ATP-binding protein [Methylotenera sp.]